MAGAKALTCNEAVSRRLTVSSFQICGVGVLTRVRGGQSGVEGWMHRVPMYAQWDATDSGPMQRGGGGKSLEDDAHVGN